MSEEQRIALSLEDTSRLAQIVHRYGSVAALEAALAARPKPGAHLNPEQVLKAWEFKLISNRAEARRLLGLAAERRRPTPPRGGEGRFVKR